MNTVELLTDARALVAIAWCQGTSRRPLGDGVYAYCASGAVWKVYRDSVPYSDDDDYSLPASAQGALDRALPEEFDGYCSTCHEPHAREYVGYNDTPGRTQEEILALFDRAIEAEKEKAA